MQNSKEGPIPINYKAGNEVRHKIVIAPAYKYDSAHDIPRVPEDQDFILVIKNPNPRAIALMVEKLHYRLQGMVLDGPYLFNFFSVLCGKHNIPLLAEPEHQIYDVVHQGNLVLIDAGKKSVVIRPHENRHVKKQLTAEALRLTIDAEANTGARVPSTQPPAELSATIDAVPTAAEANLININAQGNGFLITDGFYLQEAPEENQLMSIFTETAALLQGTVTVCALERRPGDQDALAGESTYGINFLLGAGREIFKTQCRAFLAALATHKNLRFVVPGIQNAQQAEVVYNVLEESKRELLADGTDLKTTEDGFQLGVTIDAGAVNDEQSISYILEKGHVAFILIGRQDHGHLDQPYLDRVHAMIQSAKEHQIPFFFRESTPPTGL